MIKTKVKHLGTRFVAILLALLILDGSTPWLGLSLRAEAATTKTPEQIAADAAKYGGYDIQDFGNFNGAEAIFIEASLADILSSKTTREVKAHGKDGTDRGTIDVTSVRIGPGQLRDPEEGDLKGILIDVYGTLNA